MIGFISRKYVLSFCLSICLIPFTNAQTKEQLENDRKKIINEIEKTNAYLKVTQKEKSTTINDLQALNQQVNNRKNLIENVQKEIKSTDEILSKNENTRDSINKAYKILVDQYSAILRYNYLQNLSNQKLSYLLSSESLNTFLLRYRYIKQFEGYQAQKKQELNQLRASLVNVDLQLNEQKEEREKLLALEKDQFEKLEQEKKSKNSVLKEISQKESQLKKELNKKKKEREKLNAAIEKIILEQLRAANERKANSNLSKADSKLSNDFSKNKGKLPWPVDNGFVSTKFGKQPHPTMKGIFIESKGIDINCTGSLQVKAIFEGEIVGIVKVPGYQNMVVVNHGNYHSVYSNLKDVVVRTGNKITRGQIIGSLENEGNNRGQLHFELWENKTKLNPETWIK